MTPSNARYFVANSSREIVKIWGYEYMDRMYRPEQTGGVAIPTDHVLYSGNNSEYYPHELIHLYAYNVCNNYPHFWLMKVLQHILEEVLKNRLNGI